MEIHLYKHYNYLHTVHFYHIPNIYSFVIENLFHNLETSKSLKDIV